MLGLSVLAEAQVPVLSGVFPVLYLIAGGLKNNIPPRGSVKFPAQ